MHSALLLGKCLLHSGRDYAKRMSSPNERLKQARSKFFRSAGEAADAMGVPRGTYAGHENGHRGFPASRAPQYAKKFKVTEEWLLYGHGAGEPVDPSEDDLEQMIREVIEAELTISTKIADLPRIVAPALREQLERFRADREGQSIAAGKSARGKSSRSPDATKPSAPGE